MPRLPGKAGPATVRSGEDNMFEQAFKNIDDDLRKEAGGTSELDYTESLPPARTTQAAP